MKGQPDFPGYTADEAAEALQVSPLAVRPRFTELAKAGLVIETGYVGLNASGKWATAWKLA